MTILKQFTNLRVLTSFAFLVAVATTLPGNARAQNTVVESVTALTAKANGGDSKAMVELGDRYRNGSGVSEDYGQAMFWYRKAAEGGNIFAMKTIGWLYQTGRGVPQDYVEAMRWYRKAADGGDAGSMQNIGMLYVNGWGVVRDYAQAMSWYRKAAEAGNAAAMVQVGGFYCEGFGVPKDYSQAMAWFRKSADVGCASGMTGGRFLIPGREWGFAGLRTGDDLVPKGGGGWGRNCNVMYWQLI